MEMMGQIHGSYVIWFSTVCYYMQDLIFALEAQTRSDFSIDYLLFTMKSYNWKYLRTLHYDKLAISDNTNLNIRLRFKFHRNFYIVVDDSRHLETVKRTGCLFIAESL